MDEPVVVANIQSQLSEFNQAYKLWLHVIKHETEQVPLFFPAEAEELLVHILESAVLFSPFLNALNQQDLETFFCFFCVVLHRCDKSLLSNTISTKADALRRALLRLIETEQFGHVAVFFFSELLHVRKQVLDEDKEKWMLTSTKLSDFLRNSNLVIEALEKSRWKPEDAVIEELKTLV